MYVQYLSGEMFKDSLAIDKFLCDETGGGKHGKTSVLEFLRLQDLELFWVRWLQSQWVEANVTWGVVRTQKAGLGDWDILGVDPSDFGTGLFRRTNEDRQKGPERSRDLRKVADGRALDGGIEQKRGSFHGFTNEETNGGQHGNTSVRQFGFTVSLEGGFISLGGESKRIPDSNGWKRTGDSVNGKCWCGNLGRLLGGEGAEGSGGRGEEGKGGEEFHFGG